ncbi:MAG: oxidoreductase-like domain-containing protein [Thiolinea sp.]
MAMNPEAPIPPAPNECCESGCDPCVWDIYYEELRKWQEQQKANNADSDVKAN